MDTEGTSGPDDQELKPLNYSPPAQWYESIGKYTNPQGQEMELRVRGKNADVVEEYMKGARIWFKIGPERVTGREEKNPPEVEDEEYQRRIEEEFKQIELHPELDLEIVLDVISTLDTVSPYELNVKIHPNIASGVSHTYKTANKTRTISITLNASVNGVRGQLSGGGMDPKTKRADTYLPNPPNSSAGFSGSAASDSTFTFKVTGIDANNTYSYSSSISLVRV